MSPGNGCSGCRAVTKFAGVWGRKQSLPLVWFFFILMTGVDYSKVYLFYTLMHLFLSYSLSMYILIAHMHELVDSNDWQYWVFKMLHSIYMYGQGQDGGKNVIFPVGKRACFYLWRWISAELLFSLLLNFSEIKENKQMLFQKWAFVIMLPVWPWFCSHYGLLHKQVTPEVNSVDTQWTLKLKVCYCASIVLCFNQ